MAANQANTIAWAAAPSAQEVLLDLQVEQHHHDEVYHREIARLSLHHRLNHMALHFAKYAGKVAAATDAQKRLAVYVDVFVIAVSSANILNLKLWEILPHENRDYPGLQAFGRALPHFLDVELDDGNSLLRETAKASGRMAAACEKIDHLEEISFRAEMRASIATLSAIALAFIAHQGIDPAAAVRARLSNVKERLALHGRI